VSINIHQTAKKGKQRKAVTPQCHYKTTLRNIINIDIGGQLKKRNY
jgi:hypothetical protein